MTREWHWIAQATIHTAHDRLLALHGGLSGIRDQGAIDSALARPQNLAAYGEPDAADLAAAYAFGLVKNHGFADGNKRTGWLAAELFLVLNGYRFLCDDATLVLSVERLAAGRTTQEQFAAWIREHLEEVRTGKSVPTDQD
jgi:death-on-curing protein